MYGIPDTDPAVRYYDIAFAAGAVTDIAWFVAEAQAAGSPVLDLCCGTGRITIELARKGIDVTALDNSSGMLSLLERKLHDEPAEVRSRIRIQNQSMDHFRINARYRCVVCCDAFFHNLSPEAERCCLLEVNRHLRPGGLFLFNIHNNPNPEFLSWLSSPEAAKPRKRGTYPLPDGAGTLHVSETLSHDPLDQRVETKLHFSVTGPGGNTIEQADSVWHSRYLCRFEALYLLELCGFSVQAVFGGYQDEPVSISSQLVIKSRKTRNIRPISGAC